MSEQASEKPVKASGKPPALLPASGSGSAEVHRLLAERATAEMNGDKKALAVIDSELADHGVAVDA
jgi:hypothetical protein